MLAPIFNTEGLVEAGCDEAGRGCLAGPVYAAAVILPCDYENELLNDSKQLTAKKRYALREQIQRDAIAWAVGVVSNDEIDEINILNASILAMQRALDQLQVRPEYVIIDGNRFKRYIPGSTQRDNALAHIKALPFVSNKEPYAGDGEALPHATIVKGDAKYLSIAAASILAKTYRDDCMKALHADYPYYGWDHNAGYPTKEHRAGIVEHGLTPHHRKSFNQLGDEGQLLLSFDE